MAVRDGAAAHIAVDRDQQARACRADPLDRLAWPRRVDQYRLDRGDIGEALREVEREQRARGKALAMLRGHKKVTLPDSEMFQETIFSVM